MGSSSRPASSVQTQVRQEYPAFFQPHLEDVKINPNLQYRNINYFKLYFKNKTNFNHTFQNIE